MSFLLQAQRDSGKKTAVMHGKVHGKPENGIEKQLNKPGDQLTEFAAVSRHGEVCSFLAGLVRMTCCLWMTNGDGEQLSAGQDLRGKATARPQLPDFAHLKLYFLSI